MAYLGARVGPDLRVRKDAVHALLAEVPGGERPVPVAVLVGAVEQVDLGEHGEDPVLQRDAPVGRLDGAEQLELVAHERRAGDVFDEEGDVDLVGERVLGVAARLVRGGVDAGQVHEHHAGHRASTGMATVTSLTARTRGRAGCCSSCP